MADFTLIKALSARMKLPLPGEEAQNRMSPISGELYRTIEPNHKLASVMLLLYPKETIWHIALIKRTNIHPDDKHAGQISLPGGKLDDVDQNDFLACAIRETEEEIGINATHIQPLGALTPLYIYVSKFLVYPHIGYLTDTPQFFPQESEVESIFEIPVHYFLDANSKGVTNLTVRNLNIPDVPFYDIHGHVLWGATAMILSEFEHLLREVLEFNSNSNAAF